MSQPIRVQVSPDHYTGSYLDAERQHSFDLQEAFLLEHEGSLLEIGIGPGILQKRLRAQGRAVVSADFDLRLAPDVGASITDLPFRGGAFAAVAAFEVLEHLPVARLPDAVKELCRVARERVVVSVPRKGDLLKTYASLYLLRRSWEGGEHYWELGLHVTKARFLRLFHQAGYGLEAYDGTHPYHRFFVFSPAGEPPFRALPAAYRRRWRRRGT